VSLQPGSSFGPYEILSAIGAGGMGEVYRARDTRLGRAVAIKTLPESLATDPERLARFRREAETLAALNHPNIATIFGLEEIDGVLALAMELVEGPTLDARLKARAPEVADGARGFSRAGLPLDETLLLAKQLTLALEAAHERGIIHRDLKPANIKLTADGSLKLLDFGLAKALDPVAAGGAGAAAGFTASPTMSVMATQAGMLLGTAAYMSPEQVRGAAVDKRADIWAFGVVVYEMLTGRGLFGGDTISDTLAGVLREPIDLDKLPDGTPRAIRQLLARCLERDPKRRLRDIGEARIAIDDYLADPRDVVPPVAAPTTQRRLAVAARWTLVAALAAALAILLVERARRISPATGDAASFDIDLGGLTLRSGIAIGGYVAISPDGRRVVVTAMPDSDAPPQPGQSRQQRLYQRTLDRLEFTPLPGTEESAIPFISPDSQWVGFVSRGRMQKVAFAGGVTIRICDVIGNIAGATWLQNDTIVFASGGRLFQVPAGGGTPRPLTAEPAEGSSLSWPAAIAGRNAVVYAVRSTIGPRIAFRVGALDLDSGKEGSVADGGTYPRFVNGFVMYAQQNADERVNNGFSGGILAVPFDPAKLTATGPPVAILENVRVHSGGAGNYDIASNGTTILVTGAVEGSRQVGWLSPQAASAAPAFDLIPGIRGLGPRLSRDDRVLVVQTGIGGAGAATSIFIHNLDRGGLSRLGVDGNITSPIFGPDDGMVTFWSQAERGLWTAWIDGSKPPRRLTTTTTSGRPTQFPGSWTRDGKMLAFGEFNEAVRDILLLRREDGSATPLVQSSADERDPVFSPDDRWLAYASNESGRFEVYVRPFPGPGGRSAVSTAGGVMPAWSKDGRSLYYIAESGLARVELTSTGDALRASPPKTIAGTERIASLEFLRLSPFLTRSYDVAANGRLVYARSADAETLNLKSVRLMLGFDQEIRRRLEPVKP